MNVWKVKEDATSITLGWKPVPGADGYRFYSAGVLRSKTMDPRRQTVKFSKGQEPYKVEAVVLNHLDEGTYPPTQSPDPVDPSATGYAPQSYNKGSRGQNAKFNIRINCNQSGTHYMDKKGIVYDDSGLCLGGRTEPTIPGLKPSDMTDGKEPWEPYEWMGNTFPPYPAQSYEK